MSAADICRARGWVVGDVLAVGHTQTFYKLDAIGSRYVIVVWLGNLDAEGNEFTPSECNEPERMRHTLSGWTKATPEQLAAIRPSAEPCAAPREPTLADVLEGAERALARVRKWPRWMLELSPSTADLADRSTHGATVLDDELNDVRETCTRLLGCESRPEAARALLEGLPFSVVEHEEPGSAVSVGYKPGEYGMCIPLNRMANEGMLRRIVSQGATLLAQRDREPAPAEDRTKPAPSREFEKIWGFAEDRSQPAPNWTVEWDSGDREWVPRRLSHAAHGDGFQTAAEAVARTWVFHDEDRTEPAPAGVCMGTGRDKGPSYLSPRGPGHDIGCTADVARPWELHDEEAAR